MQSVLAACWHFTTSRFQLPSVSSQVTEARLEGEGARDHFTLCQCSFCSSDWAAWCSGLAVVAWVDILSFPVGVWGDAIFPQNYPFMTTFPKIVHFTARKFFLKEYPPMGGRGELSWSNIWLKHLVVIMRCFQRIIQGEGGTASSQHWIKQPLWFNRMTFLAALLNNSFGISCQIQGPAKSRLLLVYSC